MERPSLKDPVPDRPPIWVDGRQQPKFHVRAWAMVGTEIARRSLAPRLGRASIRLAGFGATVASGRYSPATGWMGRAERFVPSRLQVGAGVCALAARVAEAGKILMPDPTPPEPLAYPDLIHRPARPVPAQPLPNPPLPVRSLRVEPTPLVPLSLAADNPSVARTDQGEPALAAIRALIHAVPDLPAEAEAPAPIPPAARSVDELIVPPRPTLGRRLLARASHLARPVLAHAIAWSCLVLVLPVGLARAGLYHLNGGDLREWE